VYAAVITSIRAGTRARAALDALASNDVAAIPTLEHRRVADVGASCDRFLMTPAIAAKLVARLRLGGYLAEPYALGIDEPPEPFFSAADVTREADKVREGVLSILHLRKMPTEMEVALATVYFMADRAVSGETFQPSGGLHLERSITERELFGGAKSVRLEAMQGTTVWVIGEHLVPHMTRAAAAFISQCGVARVVLLTRTVDAARAVVQAVARALPDGGSRIETFVVEGEIEEGMDAALEAWGHPAAVISTPFTALPDTMIDLDAARFREIIEGNVTHHFRVARKVSLFDNVRLVLVAPDVPSGASPEAFALANFVKTTLHSLTATLGVENERLIHSVPVNQINLTRRARVEEPQNARETAEELERFARAVLLESAPIVGEDESRYRSRIYRGMAITV
jgi:malonyl-CoA reductase/3-hydroxypropionate dehydrogenase (NADP+)